jgi:hypothetical protein
VGRARDLTEDAGALLLAFMAYKAFRSFADWDPRGPPWWQPDYTDKGGRGAGAGRTTTPVPQGGANLWSEVTMRVFEQHMRLAGIDPQVALLGIAAASNFNTDETLGSNVGLMMVQRQDLVDVGYPGVPLFEQTDAVHQIPWIGKVIAYRIASAGGIGPKDVPELAVLLHPANPTITEIIRNEARRRAAEAEGTMIYIAHSNLLRHVLANP